MQKTLNDFHQLFSKEIEIYHEYLEKTIDEMGLSQSIILSGKKIRFMFTLLLARHFKVETNHALQIAIAVELIHTASILHDDVIDEQLIRRGNFSAPSFLGNKMAVLLGDALIIRALNCLSFNQHSGCPSLNKEKHSSQVQNLHKALQSIADILQGEIDHYTLSFSDKNLTEKTLHINKKKTASLFVLSCDLLLSISDQKNHVNWLNFCEHFGAKYQILDDYNDYFGTIKFFEGKPGGKDFEQRKITFPLAWLLEQTSIDLENYSLEDILELMNKLGIQSAMLEKVKFVDSVQLPKDLREFTELLRF